MTGKLHLPKQGSSPSCITTPGFAASLLQAFPHAASNHSTPWPRLRLHLTNPQEHARHLTQTAATNFAGQLVSSMSPVETLVALVLENPAYDVVARRFADFSPALKAGVGSIFTGKRKSHGNVVRAHWGPRPHRHRPCPYAASTYGNPAANCLNI